MHVKKRALITDLDNTLFDWVHIWFCCFRSMLDQMIMISGVPEAILIPEIKAVHQRHGTSEYSFLIEELPSLRRTYPGANLLNIFKPAIDAYRAQRRQHLKLYPSVAEALQQIKNRGSRIIGYTESMTFYSNYRVRHLGLDGVLDEVFSPADHDIPEGISLEQIRQYPAESYQLKSTVQQHTPKDSKKPNVDV